MDEKGTGRLTSRIKSININREIHWPLQPDSISNLLDNSFHPNRIYLPRLHDFKSAISIVVIVTQPAQRRAYASVDVGIIGQQPLLMRVVEVRSMIDGCLLGRCAAENFGPPGVKVRVEVDDADGAVSASDGAEEWERDGVVATEGDDAWKSFAFLCGPNLFGVGHRIAHEESIMAFFDLLDSVGVVVAVKACQC